MTRVFYDEEELELRVEGHAKGGPKGGDLICAGCSVLWLTLEEALSGDADRVKRLWPTFYREEAGRAVICCPQREAESECRTILQTVAAGYRALAESFPDSVSFQEGGGGYPERKE